MTFTRKEANLHAKATNCLQHELQAPGRTEAVGGEYERRGSSGGYITRSLVVDRLLKGGMRRMRRDGAVVYP